MKGGAWRDDKTMAARAYVAGCQASQTAGGPERHFSNSKYMQYCTSTDTKHAGCRSMKAQYSYEYIHHSLDFLMKPAVWSSSMAGT